MKPPSPSATTLNSHTFLLGLVAFEKQNKKSK